jgi:ATP-binding cassette subfamily B protein
MLDLFSALSIALIDLLFPTYSGKILNDYLPNSNFRAIILVIIFLFLAYLLRLVFAYIVSYYGHIMGVRIEKDMRKDLFEKYELLDYEFFDENKTGQLMANITNNLRDISEMSHHAPEDLFISTIMFIGSFCILLFYNVLLTLIMTVMVAIVCVFSILRRKKMEEGFRNVRYYHGELNSQLESSISGIRLTKAFTNEDYENEKFERINNEYLKSWNYSYKQMGIFSTGNEFLLLITNLVLLASGSYFVYKGYISATDLYIYFLYINFLVKPINRLVSSMEQINQGWTGFEKFYEIMEIKPSIVNKPNAVILKEPKGEIEFKNACFTYPASNEEVLSNFSIKIGKGKKIGLIGETGVGKSTISKLIPRFYDLTSGEILIDGINIKDFDLYSLRNAIGHVQQDVFIFYGTIKENILYGKVDATDEEIVEAAKKANIHDYISSLEHGYDTIVGERGIKLSGGQKQRIAIARLFLKDPSILILDEATSSLDNITEKIIQESLNELAKNRTTIIIAHRLTTIKDADEILVMDKEGIVERGTHDQLIASDSYYAKLYNASNAI